LSYEKKIEKAKEIASDIRTCERPRNCLMFTVLAFNMTHYSLLPVGLVGSREFFMFDGKLLCEGGYMGG
jgi:hypothetical protein